MSAKRDYYEILGVARTASSDEIRKAFRSLARKHHPDVNQGSRDSEEAFKELKEAYDILGDPQKRSHYDQFGHTEPGMAGAGNFGDFGGEIFDLFFGGGRRETGRRNGPQRGEDLRHDLEISLEEAAKGVEKTFAVAREQNCEACSGVGMRNGAAPATCSTCAGAGQVRRTQQTILGSFASVSSCPHCSGTGVTITDPCPDCRGRGRQRVESSVTVQIPAGVDTGNAIQMSHEGNRGRAGGPPGDLIVVIHVQDHEQFERRGNDLIEELNVSFSQAALGVQLEVPTLLGQAALHIPAGSQAGQVFRLRGEGMPDLNRRTKGDLHVILRIPVPKKLNDRQRRAIEELAASFTDGNGHDEGEGDGSRGESHGLRGLLEKAREVFDKER